MTTTKVEPTWE